MGRGGGAASPDSGARIIIYDWEHALHFRNGKFVGTLPAGPHRFLNPFQHNEVRRLPRFQWLPQPLVEAVSEDRFPLRISLSWGFEIDDPKLAFDAQYLVQVPLAVSVSAAQCAAEVKLEDLMVGRFALGEAIKAKAPNPAPGCSMRTVQVTAIVLPPEVRRMFTEVERARRESEASLERARGEQASLRSLANAARMLKGNPELMNLRLLQAVGGGPKVATLVLGSDALSKISPGTPDPLGEPVAA